MVTSVVPLLQEAIRSQQRGQLGEAERLCRMALRQDSRNFEALYLLGLVSLQQGRIEEALSATSAAVKRNPASVDALMLLGSILLAQKRHQEALSLFDRAVVVQPRNLDARYNRAVVFGQLGKLPQALAGYEEVIAAQPNFADAWFNRGGVLAQLGRHQEALDSFDRTLQLAPNNLDALNNRGNALAMLGRHEAAVESFDRLLALNSGYVDGLSNRATSLNALGRSAEALASCEQALSMRPDHLNALTTRGNVLHAMRQYDEALVSFDRALTFAPADVGLILNRNLALVELGRFDEAFAEAERAMAIDPDAAAAYEGRARALQALARYEEAARDYEKVLTFTSNNADARQNLAVCYMCAGQFSQGWPNYYPERRRTSPLRHRLSSIPPWEGAKQPGTMLIWCDDGLGDVILYGGLVPELRPLVDRIVVEVDDRLVPLFARSFPDATVVNGQGMLGILDRIDRQSDASQLARHLRPSFASFPTRNEGYLVADADRVRDLRSRLFDGRPIIGLSWNSKNAAFGRFKSAGLGDFQALLQVPGLRFIDLQYGDTSAERAAVERELGVKVERLPDVDNMNDIDGLAALISACDAVMTVSNTTAHLAGALGAPTFVMIAFGRGRVWYWFPDRPTSPWYPRAQVRGQVKGQSWSELVTVIAPEVVTAAIESAKQRA